MKSSYQLRNITVRTHYADGSDVTDGPAVSSTYPLGYFREDYEYIAPSQPDYLDEHNGRFCVTPEYPNGIYAYFCTVNATWNSAYPYAVGPTFYGNKTGAKVNSITEPVTTYVPLTTAVSSTESDKVSITVYPNPSNVNELVAIQTNGLLREDMNVELYDVAGKLIQKTMLYKGSTLAYFNTSTLYSGQYLIRVYNEKESVHSRLTIVK